MDTGLKSRWGVLLVKKAEPKKIFCSRHLLEEMSAPFVSGQHVSVVLVSPVLLIAVLSRVCGRRAFPADGGLD